jgi:hypothetical protein
MRKNTNNYAGATPDSWQGRPKGTVATQIAKHVIFLIDDIDKPPK